MRSDTLNCHMQILKADLTIQKCRQTLRTYYVMNIRKFENLTSRLAYQYHEKALHNPKYLDCTNQNRYFHINIILPKHKQKNRENIRKVSSYSRIGGLGTLTFGVALSMENSTTNMSSSPFAIIILREVLDQN